ncbi:MAG: MarR family transcriptional regulator [Clostridia bacterium]|nr:MarR family transcriptional regulator [Clostridia bacterium]
MQRENDIGFAVRRLSNAIKRDVEKNRADLGIVIPKGISGWVIRYLYDNADRDVFQRDFEENFSIRPSTASRMLKAMEKKGFIERVSVENDARLKKIVLTERAIENHKLILADIKRREALLRRGISDSEITVFFETMQKLTANLEEQND